MAYVITDACTKDFVCVAECATAAIAPQSTDDAAATVSQVYINPDECIDCGVCEPECPAEAIVSDAKGDLESWLKLNAEYAQVWPNIVSKRESSVDAETFDGIPGKLALYFSPKPGQGD